MQWGAVEQKPRQYNWSAYKQLVAQVKNLGLKLQVGVMDWSFMLLAEVSSYVA